MIGTEDSQHLSLDKQANEEVGQANITPPNLIDS